MKIKILSIAVLAIAMLTACNLEPKVNLVADFSTDKEVYELYEDVILTNNSYAENARVISSKWEWDGKKMWGHNPEEPISFDKTGDFEIKLTVTSDIGNKTATCSKTIKVQDTNKRPIVDFSYTPETGLRAGDKVKFTDKSTDPDGEIVAWEWKIGADVSYEQNPEIELTEFGEIKVTLTVTDNMKGTASKSVILSVDKSINSLELAWEKAFAASGDFVKFASPALNADGSAVYVFSTGCHLIAFDKDGTKKWDFDATIHKPNPYSSDGSKTGNACTPSVDADGTIYIALAYNEKDYKNTVNINESGVYAINPDGTQKWYFPYGNARYIAVVPVVLENHIFLTTKYNPEKANYPELWEALGDQDNGQLLDKNGNFVQRMQVKQGNYGGSVGFRDGKIITHCNSAFGSRMFFPSDTTWNYFGPADNKSYKSLGWYNGKLETGDSGQMAVSSDGKVYILYTNVTGRVASSYLSVLYCYDTTKYVKDAETEYKPEWAVGINGQLGRYIGHGAVCGADGTIYVTTQTKDDCIGRVTAVTKDGVVKWESTISENVRGSAAVDDLGYVYILSHKPGKLIKLSPEDGKIVSQISLADEFISSPTISPDGTIYCSGMKDKIPTLFAVKGSATGFADSWSQLGGNPQKTCVKY